MKKVIMMMSLVALATAAMAVPAKRGLWQTITLADGTQVRVEKVGDEHSHWLRAADGACYVMTADGLYEQRDADELAAKREARLNAKQAKRRAIYATTTDGLGQKDVMSMGAVPSIGEYTIPVVMVQFTDTKFKSTTTVNKMTRYYNEEGYHDEAGCVGSVRDYFKAQSGGKFVPTFDVVGIVTLSKAASYYGKNDSDGNDEKIDELPGDVIAAAVSQLGADFSKYVVEAGDKNHYEGVPLLCMLYAGKGEATDYNAENTLWPCEWDADEDPVGEGTYQGVHFNSFFVGNELLGTKLMGMSVFCHEFGHALGLPDFYCTNGSYEGDDAFGHWSIMDSGAYVDDECRAPMGYNAYEKSYMGWLELKEMPDDGEVILQSPLDEAENSAYIIRNGATETFILENRQPGTWYSSEFGSGVLVTRIAYSKTQWMYNTLNNTQSKKRACVLTANGGKLDYSASPYHLYGNGKDVIQSLKTLQGQTVEIGITSITKNEDGTITLMRSKSTTPTPEPTPAPEGMLFYESFDQCAGKGGNDGLWSGKAANGTFLPDNEGWEAYDDKAFGGDKCAKFGTSSVNGYATTPAFTLNGTTTLTFKAGAWNAKNDQTALDVTISGMEAPYQVQMEKGAFTDYKLEITGTGSVQITFAVESGRFFLDEVIVADPTTTAINEVSVGVKTDKVFDLQGRRVDTFRTGKGIYIINGRKVVR